MSNLITRYKYQNRIVVLSTDEVTSSLTSNGYKINVIKITNGAFAGVHKSLHPGQQQDAQEFITVLIDHMFNLMPPE